MLLVLWQTARRIGRHELKGPGMADTIMPAFFSLLASLLKPDRR